MPFGRRWGSFFDIPVPGDYDGDGLADVAVFRPSDGTWYLWYSSTGRQAGVRWGANLDTPIPGDYNGDGRTDIAVSRPSTLSWFIHLATGVSLGSFFSGIFPATDAVPVVARP